MSRFSSQESIAYRASRCAFLHNLDAIEYRQARAACDDDSPSAVKEQNLAAELSADTRAILFAIISHGHIS